MAATFGTLDSIFQVLKSSFLGVNATILTILLAHSNLSKNIRIVGNRLDIFFGRAFFHHQPDLKLVFDQSNKVPPVHIRLIFQFVVQITYSHVLQCKHHPFGLSIGSKSWNKRDPTAILRRKGAVATVRGDLFGERV